jgi:hypothetical protein
MMGFKQEQYTGDFVSASNFQAVNGDSLIDNNAIMTDQEEDELESYNNHFGTTDSYPGAQYTTSLSQQQHEQKEEEYYDQDAEQDADSEMLDDGEEDEELLDYDEDSELDEEEVDVDEHEVEEELESFDEEDEDDEDDEEEEEEDGGSEGLAGNEKPGATEDDAIELSD